MSLEVAKRLSHDAGQAAARRFIQATEYPPHKEKRCPRCRAITRHKWLDVGRGRLTLQCQQCGEPSYEQKAA